jgi:preprotein translocase subunit SecY
VFGSFANIFKAPDIRRRLLFLIGILIVIRALAHVPLPGVDRTALSELINSNQLFGLLDLFSGGGLSTAAIVGLGVNPYINASIIMQLLTGVVPQLGALQREGEYGRNKINQYTRYLSVPLALLQAYGFLAVLGSQGILTGGFDLLSLGTVTQLIALTAGSVLLMWIGEIVTEKGIGNGLSFIIFAGIISRMPSAIGSFIASPDWAAGAILVVFAIAAIAVVIFIQEGQRKIPVQYASRVRGRRMYQGGQTFLPIKVNTAGVIPIIFATSILLFPGQIANYFTTSESTLVADIAKTVAGFFNNRAIYGALFFGLTVAFTYFYTAFSFKTDEVAEQLRKNGGFIPGIRPGRPTQDYLSRVVNRITLAGALFLGFVAISPYLLSAALPSLGAIGLGGTSLLIVVSVVVETIKQLEAQLLQRNYEGFIR